MEIKTESQANDKLNNLAQTLTRFLSTDIEQFLFMLQIFSCDTLYISWLILVAGQQLKSEARWFLDIKGINDTGSVQESGVEVKVSPYI